MVCIGAMIEREAAAEVEVARVGDARSSTGEARRARSRSAASSSASTVERDDLVAAARRGRARRGPCPAPTSSTGAALRASASSRHSGRSTS